MQKSETVGKLAEALVKAQAAMSGAKKDSSNPFFKSKYADLESVWEACREPLTKNGLSIVQIPCEAESGIRLETVLLHSSGEWISGAMLLHPKADDPQGMGSAITYGRRYALAAFTGVYQTDDDGEAAMDRENTARYAEVKKAGNLNPTPVNGLLDKLVEKGDRLYVNLDGKTCYATAPENKEKLRALEGKDVELLVLDSGTKVNGKPAYSIHMVTEVTLPEAVNA